ncbi:hypothetical protein [Zobellia uliginosa]|uniref:hypothetical protein n=1 Tax=Zobellia uliginosa TaxID=143224 RepID=UPI001C06AC39|nr:hypothetical protein [Zobellia uliginosa]MBU2946332.1 hypothetical protein [Zobellia uliginosa]
MIRLKLIISSLIIFLLFCNQGFENKLQGTWEYSRIIDSGKTLQTLSIEGKKESTKSQKVIDRYMREGVERFYLVYGENGELIEYKLGMGMKFKYRVSNDTIFTDNEPYYRIEELTSEKLVLKYFYSDVPTTYKKVEVDLSDHEMVN